MRGEVRARFQCFRMVQMIKGQLSNQAGYERRFRKLTEGLLCKETHEHVIRFAPPLVLRREDVDWAMGPIEEVLRRG